MNHSLPPRPELLTRNERLISNAAPRTQVELTLCVAMLMATSNATPLVAQADPRQTLPPEIAEIASTMAAMAGQKSLPAENVANMRSWIEPADPFRIVGPIYGFYGLGMALYFATQGFGSVISTVMANAVRLLTSTGCALVAIYWLDLGAIGFFVAIAGGFCAYAALTAAAMVRVTSCGRACASA